MLRKTRNGMLIGAAAMLIGPSLFGSNSAMGALIDDFSTTTLSPAYTQTAILDQGSVRNVNFQSPSGTLQANSAGSDGAEQVVLFRSDVSLGVGQILRADVGVVGTGLSQDLGIAVGATATPTALTRSDYIFAGFRGDNTHFLSSGFNGTTSLGTNQVFGLGLTGVFIRRNTATSFDVGYNNSGGPDTTAFTFTVANTNIGNAVGFYTDMRASNTIGNLDNLRIDPVPEPASIGLLGLAGLGLLQRRRTKA